MKIIRLQGDAEIRSGIYYEYDVDATPLGEGGMGRVFKGFRVSGKTGERTPIAIKVIYDNIPERIVERARREANIQMDNENLARMYGFIEMINYYEGGTKCKVHYYIIMELLVGVTLEDLMKGVISDQNGNEIPFAVELYNQYTQNRNVTVVRIMKSILSGLMALHDKGYIHRDIDPSNVMVTIDGKIKLIDFGICKQIESLESLDTALTATGVFMGKVNYAAPELVLGDVKSQSYTTDIYALGVLLYQLCSGRLPFSGTDLEIQNAHLRNSLPLKEVQHNKMRTIIRKATDKKQSKRYQSVVELRADLDRSLSNKTNVNIHKNILFVFLLVLIGTFVYWGAVIINERNVNNKENLQSVNCNSLYSDAVLLIESRNPELYNRGKETLRLLVEDSLYAPAELRYYVLLLNSTNKNEVVKGYNEIKKMAQSEVLNHTAMFECGLTLSKGNQFINVPTKRQTYLKIDVDLDNANQWLYKSMEMDTTDYKSVYWILNNLTEKMKDGKLSSNEEEQLTKLYTLFKERTMMTDDNVVEIYKKAIANIVEQLKVQGLIK